MKDKERDIVDELFRSKLQDFETDVVPGDWEAISGRLPGKAPVPFRRMLRYWAAAAVIALLMISGGIYMYNTEEKELPMAEAIRQETEAIESNLAAKEAETSVVPIEQVRTASAAPVAVVSGNRKNVTKIQKVAIPVVKDDDSEKMDNTGIATLSLPDQGGAVMDEVENEVEASEVEQNKAEQPAVRSYSRTLVADVAPVKNEKKVPARKWSFGMGGGSVSAGTTNSVNSYLLRNSTAMVDQDLFLMNSLHMEKRQPAKTNIKHKTPVTVGFGVSRYLNDRFSLQSGLNYTFLSSQWETNGDVFRETKQKLHFIGIPLSISYKIAEWKRIQFYAAAGGMAEVNIAGRVDSKLYNGKDIMGKEHDHTRMKELLWSVNSRVGASYPLVRFLSVYAEAGVGYYFDNGSKIETIRSEKPFNVNLQAGFRLGF